MSETILKEFEKIKEDHVIQWTNDLAVNVLDIDDQHRELFLRLNRCFDAVDGQAGLPQIRELFTYLNDYVVTHFRTEEAYMDRHLGCGYPDYEQHRAQHRAFATDLREFERDLDDKTAGKLIAPEFRDLIRNWLLLHIAQMDKGLGKALQDVLPLLAKPRQHPGR